MSRLTIFILLFFSIQIHAQKFIGNNGEISFFSEAPLEDISAINKKVSAVYDSESSNLVFQLIISDFVFPKSLMQEHFNENYLESDIYPNSTFQGKIIERHVQEKEDTRVEGNLTIHGITNKIIVEGQLLEKEGVVSIKAKFSIKLKDYNIKIPRLVMYNIAEEIEVMVNIQLKKI